MKILLNVVKQVGKAMDFNIVDTRIDACHRLGKEPGPKGPPTGIIVKFVPRATLRQEGSTD